MVVLLICYGNLSNNVVAGILRILQRIEKRCGILLVLEMFQIDSIVLCYYRWFFLGIFIMSKQIAFFFFFVRSYLATAFALVIIQQLHFL